MNILSGSSMRWVIIFWIGFPLFIFGCLFGIPRVFTAADPAHRWLFAAWPVIGIVIAGIALTRVIRRAESSGTNRFEVQWYKRYYVESGVSLILYVVLNVLCIPLAASMSASAPRLAVALIPSIGLILCAVAIIRWIIRADEYMRQKLLQDVAIATAITAVWTMTYGSLEAIGYPRLSMFLVWPSMSIIWSIVWGLRCLFTRTARI